MNDKGFFDPSQCGGDLYIYLASDSGESLISIRCNECKLDINNKTHRNHIKTWNVKDLQLALARMMLVCASENTIFPHTLPCVCYLDSANSLSAYIPLLDTGFSTPQDGKIIYLAPFLPSRFANWDLEKGEWVPQTAFENLAESSAMIIKELLNNRRSLELSDKHIIGR
jgi:hypothetical protein